MKVIKTTLAVLLTTSMYSQSKTLNYVNSGAMSRNLSCGIGEIFVLPPRVEEKQELIPNKEPEISNLIASPNPTSGIVYLKTDLEIKVIGIFSPEGRWLKDVDISREKRIDLSNMPSGLYTLIAREPSYQLIKIIKK